MIKLRGQKMKRSTYHQIVGALVCAGEKALAIDLAKLLNENKREGVYESREQVKIGNSVLERGKLATVWEPKHDDKHFLLYLADNTIHKILKMDWDNNLKRKFKYKHT